MLKVWCSWNKVIVTYVNNWNGLSSYLVQYSTKLPQCYQPYTCFVRPYSSVILFFTPVKYRISVVTRFEHICHSSWEICDRSRFFLYTMKSHSSQVKKCMIFLTKKNVLQMNHICHRFLRRGRSQNTSPFSNGRSDICSFPITL